MAYEKNEVESPASGGFKFDPFKMDKRDKVEKERAGAASQAAREASAEANANKKELPAAKPAAVPKATATTTATPAVTSAPAGSPQSQIQTVATTAGQQAAGYDKGAAQSMGGNAADYMAKAQQAAQAQAQQAGNVAATQGIQNAIRAARSQGLNKGQAALAGAQQTGDIYTNAYQGGLQSGADRYMGATQQFANQGNTKGGMQLSALGTAGQLQQGQQGLNIQQQGQDLAQQSFDANQQAAKDNQFWGTLGTIAGGVGSVLSDERCKEDIRDMGGKLDVMAIAKQIRPVAFRYKKTVENPGDKIGVMAQDLEKTALSDVVKTGDDGIKRINTDELTPALLNLVVQLAQEVAKLKGGK